jgi:SAM-dependent methyltransferase
MTAATLERAIDQAKLEAFVGKGVNDFAAMLSSALVVIGDKLGLYRAMAGAGPLTSAELAERTGTAERYIRDWLINQAAGGYIDYEPTTGRYTLPDEHAIALTSETSPFFLIGAFQASAAVVKAISRLTDIIRTGDGMHWGEHDPDLFAGTERLFRPGYMANLVSSWIPALEGVEAKLRVGAKVADIGCGHGVSTILMAQAYPQSRFVGFDNHAPSIDRARQEATAVGATDRATFEIAGGYDYPGANYDLITFFDCLHHMDPVAALLRAYQTLAPDGAVLLVEPMAGELVEENFNPVGRAYSGFSVLCCMPDGVAACGCEHALGTIATEGRLREVASRAGFTRFRRIAETPFNRIFEVRP